MSSWCATESHCSDLAGHQWKIILQCLHVHRNCSINGNPTNGSKYSIMIRGSGCKNRGFSGALFFLSALRSTRNLVARPTRRAPEATAWRDAMAAIDTSDMRLAWEFHVICTKFGVE